MGEVEDREAIGRVVETFFGAFATGAGLAERMQRLRELFLPGAVIVRTCGAEPLLYDVDGFIEPRQRLLASGELGEFREWEVDGRTDLFGDIAQRFCAYAKTGGEGMKSVQLVRTGAGWRISGVIWDDGPTPQGRAVAGGTDQKTETP